MTLAGETMMPPHTLGLAKQHVSYVQATLLRFGCKIQFATFFACFQTSHMIKTPPADLMILLSNMLRLLFTDGGLKIKTLFQSLKGCGRGNPSKFDDSPLLATKRKVTNNFYIHCPILTK